MRNSKASSSYSHNTKKIRKIIKEEARLGINRNSDSETEVDFRKELHPLSHYINNKEEMIEQMFSIIKGAKLEKMLPRILKGTPLSELKADCLLHLLGMSKKRIQAILEGREINSSSDSETHSDSPAPPRKKAKRIVKPIVIKQEGCSDISDNSEEVVLVAPDPDKGSSCKDIRQGGKKSKRRHKEKKKKKIKKKEEEPLSNKISLKNSKEPIEVKESSSDSEIKEVEPLKEGKTLLEILELEMRARAIRALLQKDGTLECKETTTEKLKHKRKDHKIKSIKSSKETKNVTEKVTPIKNFRKKKLKNDDVIVIAPKVVTIDLTGEKDHCNITKKKLKAEQAHLKLGTLLNNIHDNTDKESNKSPERRNDTKKSSNVFEPKTVAGDVGDKRGQTISTNPGVSLVPPANSCVQHTSKSSQETEPSQSSWARRWLESKEVKKVVSTSKICGNIRKKIKNARLFKQKQENSQIVAPELREIQGSVDEYQLLSKSSRISNSNVGIPVSNNPDISSAFILVEGETTKPTEIETNQTEPSIEQVQDITSTKNETPTENSLQENVVDSLQESGGCNSKEIHDNVQTESNICDVVVSKITSELKLNDSTSSKAKICEPELAYTKTETFELIQSMTNNIPCESSTVSANSDSFKANKDDVAHSKSEINGSQLLNHTNISEYKSNSNNINNSRTEHCRFAVYDQTNSEIEVPDTRPSRNHDTVLKKTCKSDIKGKLIHSDVCGIINSKTKISISQTSIANESIELCKSELNLDILEIPNAETNELIIKDENTTTICDSSLIEGKTLSDGTSSTKHFNEPETLEICITDEDQEMD